MRTRIFVILLTISLIGNGIFAYKIFQTKPLPAPEITATAVANPVKPDPANWIPPVDLVYDIACLIPHAKCPDYGEAQLGGGQPVRARLFLSPDQQTTTVKFFMGTEEWPAIPPFSTPSYVTDNPEWFGLKIWYIGSGNLYISTGGGHEGYPAYFRHLGDDKGWQKFDPWAVVKGEFAETSPVPFSIDFSDLGSGLLRLTEQNYCCDTVHLDTPDRNNYRKVFLVQETPDGKGNTTYTVVGRSSVPR